MTRAGAIFQLAFDRDAPPRNLRLRNAEWGVLFAIDGKRSAGEILRRLDLSEARGAEIFESLLDRELIQEREVSYQEYVAAQTQVESGKNEEPRSLAEFLFGGALLGEGQGGDRAAVAEVSPTRPSAPVAGHSPQKASNRDPNDPAPGLRSRPVNFRPLESAQRPAQAVPSSGSTTAAASPKTANPSRSSMPATPVTPARRLSLKNVIEFILNRAPDLNAGQLDVYRVFIRINTQLLKRNGIHSLRFTDDHVITDPELQHAILNSVERTLGIKVPGDVFV